MANARSFNPLNEAQDQACILMDTSRVLNPLSHNGNSNGEFSIEALLVSYLLPAEGHHRTHHSVAGDEAAEKPTGGTGDSCIGFWDLQESTCWSLNKPMFSWIRFLWVR